MIPYILLILPIFALSPVNFDQNASEGKTANFIFYFYFLLLTLFAGLRINTGFDYSSYQRIFSTSMERSYFKGSIEAGYILLNQIVYKIFNNYNVMLIIISLICLVFIIKFIKRYSPYHLVSLYFYIISYFIGGVAGHVRQALAVSILTLSFKYIEERDLKKFLFCLLIACSFHAAALVFILLYFIYPITITKSKIAWSSLLILILGEINVFDLLLPVFNALSSIKIFSSIVSYTQSEHMGDLSLSFGFLERAFMIVLILIFLDEILANFKHSRVIVLSYLVSSWMYFFFIEYGLFARRLSGIFKIADIILLAMIVYCIKSRYLKIIMFMGFGLLFLLRIYGVINNPSGHYLPYSFIF